MQFFKFIIDSSTEVYTWIQKLQIITHNDTVIKWSQKYWTNGFSYVQIERHRDRN